MSISVLVMTCAPRRGSLRLGAYWALPFRFAPVTVGSARGFTLSATRSELNCYDYAVLPTRKAVEPFLMGIIKDTKILLYLGS